MNSLLFFNTLFFIFNALFSTLFFFNALFIFNILFFNTLETKNAFYL